MVPIPVFWTKYTATAHGRTLKVVSCENCSTEYLYVMEREGTGVGTSVYMLNGGAEDHATSAATDTLQSVLENDFDAVPCPACGHYQRYMFPKLLETTGMWEVAIKVLILLVGSTATLVGARYGIAYLQDPTDHALRKTAAASLVLLLVCLIGFGLWIRNRVKIRRFNPNATDQAARIAIGRSRAVARAEFERTWQERTGD